MDIAREDFDRLEKKVDKVADAIYRMVLVEERQTTQAQRMSMVEERLRAAESQAIKTDRKVDQWVNRGIGVWGFAAVVFAIFQLIKHA